MPRGVPAYLSYWGKAQALGELSADWHPAAYHGLDVAAVGSALIDTRPQLLTALARASGLPEDLARRWFLFALALHDIGKFACCFQAKVPERFNHRDQWTSLPLARDPGHGRVGLALWEGGCEVPCVGHQPFTPLFGSSPNAFDAYWGFSHWMTAVAGHHGRPVEQADLRSRVCPAALVDARAYVEDCAALFAPRIEPDGPKTSEKTMKRASWLVGGLAMLCD